MLVVFVYFFFNPLVLCYLSSWVINAYFDNDTNIYYFLLSVELIFDDIIRLLFKQPQCLVSKAGIVSDLVKSLHYLIHAKTQTRTRLPYFTYKMKQFRQLVCYL